MSVPFEYELTVSLRARSIRVTIYRDGRVKLTIPRRFNNAKGVAYAEKFLMQKSEWIVKRKNEFERNPPPTSSLLTHISGAKLAEYKKQALVVAEERLRHFNQFYGFKWASVRIKNQKTRWGSCSRRGNINFNVRIVLLAPEQRDYVVVHELCHLGQLNHSKKFWALVAQTMPNYKEIRRGLKLL